MTMFDNLSDAQLLNITQEHLNKFNKAWLIIMANHYSNGVYIEAESKMKQHYKILGDLERYIYSNRALSVYESFKSLSNY